jgi:hypothetical protein
MIQPTDAGKHKGFFAVKAVPDRGGRVAVLKHIDWIRWDLCPLRGVVSTGCNMSSTDPG